MIVTALPEQTVMHNIVYIQLIQERITILVKVSSNVVAEIMVTNLGDRSGKDHNLVKFADALHELIDTGPFDHINIVILTLDFNRYCEVSLMKYLQS